MMSRSAETIAMTPVGERHTIQQPLTMQKLHCPVDGCPPNARVVGLQISPEVLRSEIGLVGGERREMLGNESAGTSSPQAKNIESGQDGFGAQPVFLMVRFADSRETANRGFLIFAH
jgi:hypothetical protein